MNCAGYTEEIQFSIATRFARLIFAFADRISRDEGILPAV